MSLQIGKKELLDTNRNNIPDDTAKQDNMESSFESFRSEREDKAVPHVLLGSPD
jgi:hypothetical protein